LHHRFARAVSTHCAAAKPSGHFPGFDTSVAAFPALQRACFAADRVAGSRLTALRAIRRTTYR